jgi:DNA modification methylase
MNVEMKVELWPVERVIPYIRNPRRNDHVVAKAAASIKEFGFRQPIVVDVHDVIIVGHTRLKAAQALGLTHVPVHVAEGLTPAQVRAYRIADNRIGEEAEWDNELLALEVDDLKVEDPTFDVALTGFDSSEIDAILAAAAAEASPVVVEGNTDPDAVPEAPAQAFSARGDLWLLGRHRLLCGDCRDFGDVSTLFGEERVAVAVTSPPYAAQREYDTSSGFTPIPPEEYVEWYRDVAANIMAHLAEDGSYFLNIKEHCEDGERHLYVKDLTIAHKREWGWNFVDEFVWSHGGTPKAVVQRFKNGWEPIFQFTRGRHKFRPEAVTHETDHVPDWGGLHPNAEDVQQYGTTEGMRRKGVDARARKSRPSTSAMQGVPGGNPTIGLSAELGGRAYPSNVLSLGKNREALGHSAAFPVSLPTFFIKAFSDEGDVVFDPFMGSGTTLMAAEREGRRGFGTELSPKYVDVIVQRWCEFTGQSATCRRADGTLAAYTETGFGAVEGVEF